MAAREQKCNNQEHNKHLARVLESFYDQHGDSRHWTSLEWFWHDRLVERVNREDGFTG